jgi:hypothetical protein
VEDPGVRVSGGDGEAPELVARADGDLRLAAVRGTERQLTRTRREAKLAWSGQAVSAVHAAYANAASHGVERPHDIHLLRGVLEKPGTRAAEALDALGVWPRSVLRQSSLESRLDADADYGRYSMADRLRVLDLFAGLAPHRSDRVMTGVSNVAMWLARKDLPARLAGMIEYHAGEEAIWLGQERTRNVHLLLALARMGEEMAGREARFDASVARHNEAGEILCRHGFDHRAAQVLVAAPGFVGLPAAIPPDSPRSWGMLVRVPLDRDAVAAVEAAGRLAADRGHPRPGATHLLSALLADPFAPPSLLLRQAGVDPAAVAGEAISHLGQDQ